MSRSSEGTSLIGVDTGTGTGSTPPRTEMTAGSETGYEVCFTSDSLTSDLSASGIQTIETMSTLTPTGAINPARGDRPAASPHAAPSLRLETTRALSDTEELYGTANSSLRSSQVSESTTYENTSIRHAESESRTASFESAHPFRLSGSETWATPMLKPPASPGGSTYGAVSEQSTERQTSFAKLEPRSDIFYDSVAANIVGSPPVSPRGSIYPTFSDWNTGRSTTSIAALEASAAARGTPRGSIHGTISERSTNHSISLDHRSIVYDYGSVAASVVGSAPWGSSSSPASLDLPEIPSESRLNSPAASLATLGSSERGTRRPASPALSSAPSMIPSISSLASNSVEGVLSERVRSPSSTQFQGPVPLSSLPVSPTLSTPSNPIFQRESLKSRSSFKLSSRASESPLLSSAEQIVDAPTPTSTPLIIERTDSETLSPLSPFPSSVPLDSASSAATPTSLIVSSESEDESVSDETLSISSSTQASTDFQPPVSRVKEWGSTTDLSYNSSVLLPSPSIPSVSFKDEDEEEEEAQASFDTSFLRPSSGVYTSPRASVLSHPLRPPGPIPPSTVTSSFPPSISSPSSISTPSSLRLASVSSPRTGRPLPRIPISLATESLISRSLVGSDSHLPLGNTPVAQARPTHTPSLSSLEGITPTETRFVSCHLINYNDKFNLSSCSLVVLRLPRVRPHPHPRDL